MNNKLVIVIAIAIIISGPIIWLVLADEDKTENSVNNNKIEDNGLPRSLDQYYTEPIYPGMPYEYLFEMYKLGESMMGIIVNLGQEDFDNVFPSFNEFSECYDYSSEMVPEWEKYYDQEAVINLGDALNSNNPIAVGKAMGEVGETCSNCHLDTMTPVYYKYYWGDFSDVEIETPDGPKSWKEAKMNYLLVGFDGIGVNIKEGDHEGVKQSFELFNLMFDNIAAACLECHDSEPLYYVNKDIQKKINFMGAKIKAKKLADANDIRYDIGNSCHRCHVVHLPPQYAKVDGE